MNHGRAGPLVGLGQKPLGMGPSTASVEGTLSPALRKLPGCPCLPSLSCSAWSAPRPPCLFTNLLVGVSEALRTNLVLRECGEVEPSPPRNGL